MIIDLRPRGGNQDAVGPANRRIAWHPCLNLRENPIQQVTVAAIGLIDIKRIDPHPSRRDDLDDLPAGRGPDEAIVAAPWINERQDSRSVAGAGQKMMK